MINVLSEEFTQVVQESVTRLVAEKESQPKVTVERPKGHRGRIKGQSDFVTRENVAVDIGLDPKNVFAMGAITEVVKGMPGYSAKKGCGIVKDKPAETTTAETVAA